MVRHDDKLVHRYVGVSVGYFQNGLPGHLPQGGQRDLRAYESIEIFQPILRAVGLMELTANIITGYFLHMYHFFPDYIQSKAFANCFLLFRHL